MDWVSEIYTGLDKLSTPNLCHSLSLVLLAVMVVGVQGQRQCNNCLGRPGEKGDPGSCKLSVS